MFNFQKEVVLNSLDKAAVVNTGVDGQISSSVVDKKVRFLDGGEYFAKYIVENKIYYTNPIPGEKFTLTITPDTTMEDQHIQILVELGLDNDYRGDYGSALWYFRKPMLIDVVIPPKATLTEITQLIHDAFVKVVPKEYKFVDIEPYKDKDTSVVITGADSYQKVRNIIVSRYVCDDRCAGSSEEPIEVLNLSTGELEKSTGIIKYTKNNVEFGTYDYVLHNLRLPTYANLRFTSPSAPEMPVQGVNYTQFSFAYCVPRIGFGGMSVAGQTNHSTTLHTFFVDTNLVDDFKKLFEEIGITDFVELGRKGDHVITILPDAYASSRDLKAAAEIESNAEAGKINVDTELSKKADK